MRHISICILFLFFFQTMQAQQFPLFSNYEFNRLAYNPAVPVQSSTIVGNLLYRKQWVDLDRAPVSQFAGLRAGLGKIPLNIGGYYFQDEAGLIQRKGGMAMLSFSQSLGERSVLTIGVSGGMNTVKIGGNYSIADQVDNVVSNALEGQQTQDFNAGIHLQLKDFFAGFSMPQVVERDLEFSQTDTKTRLLRHYYAMAGYNIQLNEKIILEPSGLVKFVDGAPTQIDATARLIFNRFWLGGTYRFDAAAAALLGLTFNNFEIAYAYDFATTNLHNYNSGTHEIGLKFMFNLKNDRDQDGISDREDQCPDEPGTKETEGCPEDELTSGDLFSDSDRDGIPDSKDKCPEEYGIKKFDGCPWGDSDNDGLRDDIDKCPGKAGVATNDGCPVDDRDKDGVVDKYDACPDEPGLIMAGGCPDKDSDQDGIVDRLDPCPQDAGPKSNIGCPVSKTVIREDTRTVSSHALGFSIRNVYFDTDKYFIRTKHQQELDRLAVYLTQNRSAKVKMSGHTDERATDDYNFGLSKNRVEAVINHLSSRGVNRDQLIADYYGETRPVAQETDEGSYQLNRRVELELILE